VNGTIVALRLATTTRLKSFHFVSTLSTVPSPDSSDSRVVTERPLGDAKDDLHGGYTQTKWVAEKLVNLAHLRGVPTTIIRPGRITGHSQTGAANLDDFLNLFIKGCIQMKAVPLLEMPCEMTPVDYCARAIVRIATDYYKLRTVADRGYIFHLTNPCSMPWKVLMDIVIETCGYQSIEFTDYHTWRHKHLLTLNNESHCALIPLVPMFTDSFEADVRPLDVRTDNLLAITKGTGISCPPTDRTLVVRYIAYFLEKSFLPSGISTIGD
jgi:thioester reductase-like protein